MQNLCSDHHMVVLRANFLLFCLYDYLDTLVIDGWETESTVSCVRSKLKDNWTILKAS